MQKCTSCGFDGLMPTYKSCPECFIKIKKPLDGVYLKFVALGILGVKLISILSGIISQNINF